MIKSRIISAIVIIGALILLIKLLSLQVFDNQYKEKARNLSTRTVIIHPDRGLVVDRNHKSMVYNGVVYDVMLDLPFKVRKFDTTAFCGLMQFDKDSFTSLYKEAISNKYRSRARFLKNINPDYYARIQEGLWKFPNFQIETRTDRRYDEPIAAHVFGYISEISKNQLVKEEYYDIGDYVGKSGLEQYYEKELRGIKGREYYLINRFGEVKEDFEGGVHNQDPSPGTKLVSSIDRDLQVYGTKLLANKIGSIVAIEPKTGEVLSMVTTPAYDPKLFSIKELSKNYGRLVKDPNKPLFNRAVTATYPPGSVFKLVMALVGLEEGVIIPQTRFTCFNGYKIGNRKLGCHQHFSHPDLMYSIETSCNAYYCNVFRKLLLDKKYGTVEDRYNNWRSHLNDFGLGATLGIDVNQERGGNVPHADYFNKYYGKGRWSHSTIISLAIGQGELLLTPLQIANVATIIANQGYYYTPHFIKNMEGLDTIPKAFQEKHQTKVSKVHFATVTQAMHNVTITGTSAYSRIPGIDICGKTGTVQNPHGENHSVYMAFAPKDNPKIAIAVIVENAGYGSTWAAPMAHLMIEKYLKGDSATSRPFLEKRMLESNLMPKVELEVE
jgi:penicillin-binding protein 2